MKPTRQVALSLLNEEDEDKWGIIGLIHDLDYEKYPDQHCSMTRKILEEEQWPEEFIRAVVSHGWGICSDTEPQHLMEKVLFAIDELTGLVTAAGANREVIEKGTDMIGKDLNYIIQETIAGMRTVAKEIGLAGEPIQ